MEFIQQTEEYKLSSVEELLGENYLKRFRVFYPQTLFPPNFDALKSYSCPLCSHKLKFPKRSKIAYCRSIKHKKPFVISSKRLLEIIYKIK